MYLPLQQLDSIHVTILHKEEGAGLGFSLAGGADLENKVITVSGQRRGACQSQRPWPWEGGPAKKGPGAGDQENARHQASGQAVRAGPKGSRRDARFSRSVVIVTRGTLSNPPRGP